MMIMYHYKMNAILVQPLKSKNDADMIAAYSALMQRVTKQHVLPTIHVLDNEASVAFKTALQTPFQVVPLHSDRRNAAEVAIKTFKHHFIAMMAGTHNSFRYTYGAKV